MDDAEVEIWEACALKVLARMESDAEDVREFWEDLGVDREDALQEARIRAWRASETDDGQTDLALHCTCAARYGIRNFLIRSREQKGGSVELDHIIAGLDDEEVEVERVREISFTDLEDDEAEEVRGAEAQAVRPDPEPEGVRSGLRPLVDGIARSCLSDRERRFVYLRFGINDDGSVPLTAEEIAWREGMSPRQVYRILNEAMDKLRAEARADEILEL